MRVQLLLLISCLLFGLLAAAGCGPPPPAPTVNTETGGRSLATPQTGVDNGNANLAKAVAGDGAVGNGDGMGPIEPVIVAAVIAPPAVAAVVVAPVPDIALPLAPLPIPVALVPAGTTMKALAEVLLLNAPGELGTVLGVYPAGAIFTVVGNAEGGETGAYVNDVLWDRVRAPDGMTGWVRDAALVFVTQEVQAQPSPCARCVGCGVNCTDPRPHLCPGCAPCGVVACAGCPSPCGPSNGLPPP